MRIKETEGGWKTRSWGHPKEIILGYEYENHLAHAGYHYTDGPTGHDPFNTPARAMGLVTSPGKILPFTQKNVFNFIQDIQPKDYGKLGIDCGCEIRSYPAPLGVHRYIIKHHDLFKNVRFCDNESDKNGGGIHVHVGLNDYVRRAWDNVATFLHNPTLVALFVAMSGRSASHFNQNNPQNYGQVRNLGDMHGTTIIGKRRFGHTVEFRMYHARPHLLLPALQTMDSLFRLGQDTRITFENWANYLNGKPRYRELREHMLKTMSKIGGNNESAA